METLLEAINNRLDVIAKRIKTNEFSGKNINSIKSIILQISQNDLLTLSQKKTISLDILIAVDEVM